MKFLNLVNSRCVLNNITHYEPIFQDLYFKCGDIKTDLKEFE